MTREILIRKTKNRAVTVCDSSVFGVSFLTDNCLYRTSFLLGLDSAGGAGTCTASAINTGISVDLVFSITGGDSANGALALTSSAAYASVSNYICHIRILL